MNSPKEEQEICVTCGFCCDGTLFNSAFLEPDEKGNLPEKMEENYFKTKKEEFFRLPCSYFSGKCSIYNQKKAHICSAFRCKLLKDFADNEIGQPEALKIVQNVKIFKEEIIKLGKAVFEIEDALPFIKLLEKIGEWDDVKETKGDNNRQFDILKAKSIILETLLIRYFKSKKDFDKMIDSSEKGKAI